MNLQIEKDFVKKFVKKELHERIIYELTSAKYRHKALQRFSSVDSCILKPNCIALKNTKVDLGDIAEKYILQTSFLKRKSREIRFPSHLFCIFAI